jgi:hypothetical protein
MEKDSGMDLTILGLMKHLLIMILSTDLSGKRPFKKSLKKSLKGKCMR